MCFVPGKSNKASCNQTFVANRNTDHLKCYRVLSENLGAWILIRKAYKLNKINYVFSG